MSDDTLLVKHYHFVRETKNYAVYAEGSVEGLSEILGLNQLYLPKGLPKQLVVTVCRPAHPVTRETLWGSL